MPSSPTAVRGGTPGSLVLGSRRVPMDRLRARTLAGREVQLKTWHALADGDLLS
jgi:hypothetical protein